MRTVAPWAIVPLAVDPFWTGIIAGLFVAVPAIVGTIATNRTSRKAQAAVEAVDQRKVDQETFDRITREWKDLAKAADARAEAAERRASSALRRIAALEAYATAQSRWGEQAYRVIVTVDPHFPHPPRLPDTQSPEEEANSA